MIDKVNEAEKNIIKTNARISRCLWKIGKKIPRLRIKQMKEQAIKDIKNAIS